MLPAAPEAGTREYHSFLIMACQIIHIEAYIVYVDMVLKNEVAWKLTPDTIEALTQYHKDIHCEIAKSSTYNWSGKEQQCKNLHQDFIRAVNKYVYTTHVEALEGLEEDGELLRGKGNEVKTDILGLLKPISPPPGRLLDGSYQPPPLPKPSYYNIDFTCSSGSYGRVQYSVRLGQCWVERGPTAFNTSFN